MDKYFFDIIEANCTNWFGYISWCQYSSGWKEDRLWQYITWFGSYLSLKINKREKNDGDGNAILRKT